MKGLPMQINGLYIDELSILDCSTMLELMNQEAVQKYVPDRFENLEEMQGCIKWLISNYTKDPEDIIRLTFALRSKSNQSMIGWVSYGPLPADETLWEVAYVIHPDYWGRGYASSALQAFIAWLGLEMKVGELYAEVDCSNTGSIKVLEKSGFLCQKTFVSEDGASKYLYYLRC